MKDDFEDNKDFAQFYYKMIEGVKTKLNDYAKCRLGRVVLIYPEYPDAKLQNHLGHIVGFGWRNKTEMLVEVKLATGAVYTTPVERLKFLD
jgi:hypothetical protein